MNTRLTKKITTALVISSLWSVETFAENETSFLQGSSNNKESDILSLGVWFNDFFSKETFTPNIFSTITNIETTSTRNDVCITWVTSILSTSRIYYDTKSPVVIASTTPFVLASAKVPATTSERTLE